MGTIQNLTQEQKIILDEVKQDEYLRSRFYFTGGTALRTVYLQHRYSDDLDFFSQQTLENQTIFTLMQQWSQKHTFLFESRFVEVVYIFNLKFNNTQVLKVDFAHYPYRQLETPEVIDGVQVDSLTDIAVNKLLTISQRTEVKDFVDLYFLLQTFSVWNLMEGVRAKFRMRSDPLLVASDFLKVEDFTYLPKMIKPLSLVKLKSYFREEAKALGAEAIE